MSIERTLANLYARHPPRTPEATARWHALLDLVERTNQSPPDPIQLDLFSAPVSDVDAGPGDAGIGW